MKNIATTATVAAFAATVLAIIASTAPAALERRAEYLAAEAAFYDCIESGLDRAECINIFN